ncbi:hypothetical protein MBLNU230_g3774t1 [Neophaeotheca triangularis]
MSSSSTSTSDAGGRNEDVEADEATKSDDARDDQVGVELVPHASGEEWNEEQGGLGAASTMDMPRVVVQDEDDTTEAGDDVLPNDEEFGDYAQLGRKDGTGTPDEEGGGLVAEPSSPPMPSPLASPGLSDSIPDDTPSMQGSLTSPGRNVSPSPLTPRKAFSRTASGALQPFERRFEARRTVSGSSTASPRVERPGFLSPHSRQVSLSSHLSPGSSQSAAPSDEESQAPWDVIKWTKLRNITGQAFSEAGKRNFGRPTCMAVSALIAIGTSKGLILGFDYHQTLKIIIGQGTKAAEAGAITALAIAADYSTIAGGHANGHIFTWEINKPAKPFLQIPPVEKAALQQSPHPDGHLENTSILHIGFLGTRHTALVSADAGGMAFSHLASRGLGAVARTIKTTRLLGRYPSAAPQEGVNRKPSSVLAFSPLPLGNVEQPTDGLGLTALLTPYLLVIVSTTPIAQTQHKSPRPKDVSKHGALSGCLAWFPSVKLKNTGNDGNQESSLAKLVYCWSNVLTVLDVEVLDNGDPKDAQKPPNLEFRARSRWKAEEAIVAVQWLSRSVLGVLTISQRLLIVEDGSLQVTDSIDLLHRHIYHQDQFSHQLHAVVEQVDAEDPELHGVVADAFHMSFKAYKGRTFLLGFNDLTVGTLSNWADRLLALMESGDHIAAIRLATNYYAGGATNVTVGLPDDDGTRHEMVKERLLGMLSASLNYTFSQHDEERSTRLHELSNVCFEACLTLDEHNYLFHDVYDWYEEAGEEVVFIRTLEPHVLDGEVQTLPPDVVKALVSHFISQNEGARLEELLCRLDPHSFDLDQITTLCRQHNLYDALIYVWTRALGDVVTPLIDLLTLVKMLQSIGGDDELTDNPFFEATSKVFPFLAYSLTGRRYPSGDFMDDFEASRAKADLYEYLFAGTPAAWPPGSKKKFHTVDDVAEEPAFPYLVLLLEFDPASFMSMLNEAFEDPFLNQLEEDAASNGVGQSNGISRTGLKMTRQHIVSIMLDVMQRNDFTPEQTVFLDIFIARSLPKYPGQLVLSGSLLDSVLRRLCDAPVEAMREDCQLSVEYLLSVYRPTDVTSLIDALREARFHRVLKTVYRRERMLTELLETYFEDPEDKLGVFDSIVYCLQQTAGLNQKQQQKVKRTITAHANDLADISTARTAQTVAASAPDMLESSLHALRDSYQRFVFLQTLLEPTRIRAERLGRTGPSVPAALQASFTEKYVQLMCSHDPMHVADYVGVIPSSDLRMDEILPSMEESGVVDAAVVLLARDGLARDAMGRLVLHMQSLQQTLVSLVEAAGESPDIESTVDSIDALLEDVQKYTKVGIWLCQGQSATVIRRPRPRANIAWDIQEDDLDLDEYLWLNLVDIVVQVTKNVSSSLQHDEDHPTPNSASLDAEKTTSALRSNVQQSFTALLAATSTPQPKTPNQHPSQPQQTPHYTFLRVLRSFLSRAATTAPSLSDLRLVLSDIFAAYTFESSVLSLANELLGSDIFGETQEAAKLRQRGWRPRSQVCETCKRRAWGQGLGESVWEVWREREVARSEEMIRKGVERGGGVEAERLERGKGKAVGGGGGGERDGFEGEETRDLALVVFACRHCFHRSCLDGGSQRDMAGGGEERVYRCPVCAV